MTHVTHSPIIARHTCAWTPYIGGSVTSVTEQEIKKRKIAGNMISERPQPEWLDLKVLQKYACVSEADAPGGRD